MTMTTEQMDDVAEKLAEVLPDEIEPQHLAGLILSICYGYLDLQAVPTFLLACADTVERNHDTIAADLSNQP